ncbi:hypothetical protein HA402_010372 [Bradysia odoriphaga]|nr:hypothetical protein HA402_010372 [Bradysia odoriphaga]
MDDSSNRNFELKLLEHLSINDLLLVYKMDRYEKELLERTVGNKLVTVDVRVERTSEVLDVFGKSIRRIRCVGNNCGSILNTIINKCSADKIIEIQMEIRYDESECEISTHSLGLFYNLQELTIWVDKTGHVNSAREIESHLHDIIVSAVNLRVLKWTNINYSAGSFNWLRTKSLENLREFRMCTKSCISIDDMKCFIRAHPQLEIFSFDGKVNDNSAPSIIGNCLAEHCPNFKEFIFKFFAPSISYTTYYFLEFPKLNDISLTWLTLAEHPLMPFVSHYGLTKLEIDFDHRPDPDDVWQLQYSVDSSSLHIFKNILENPSQVPNFEWLLQQFGDAVRHFSKVEEISVACNTRLPVVNIQTLLELTPKIRRLSISKLRFWHLPVEINKILRTLKKHERKCHLVVSESQFRELAVRNKNSFVSFSVDPQSLQFND